MEKERFMPEKVPEKVEVKEVPPEEFGLHALKAIPELAEEYKKAKEEYGPAVHEIEERLKGVWRRLFPRKSGEAPKKFVIEDIPHERPLTEFIKPRADVMEQLELAEKNIERAKHALTQVV